MTQINNVVGVGVVKQRPKLVSLTNKTIKWNLGSNFFFYLNPDNQKTSWQPFFFFILNLTQLQSLITILCIIPKKKNCNWSKFK